MPEIPIKFDKDDIEEVQIVSSASINKDMAEYIVELHNNNLNKL